MELQLLDKLAARACLSFEGEGRERMAEDLKNIVKMMDTVAEAERFELPPEAYMHGTLREDTALPSMPAEELLANAKGRQGDFLAVPKMMD